MNNQDIVSADRISELPEALILQILSHLPTEDAVATSVLSKQWQSLWQMVPSLNFDSYNHSCEVGTFSKNVSKALLSHKAPVLQSLHLSICSHRCNAMDIGILIGIAFARNVRKLVLDVHKDRFTFPKSLYNCETLESLELKSKVLMDVPSSVCLKSLRTLHLDTADFKDDESVVNFLSGCPNLENLVLHRPDMSSVMTFTIVVPSLQRLTIYINGVNPHMGYVIKCPLKYLKIVVIDFIGFCLIEDVPELVMAELIVVSQITFEKLLESLTSVKRLSLILSPLKIKFPTGSIFDQLVYLELYTNNVACSNLLTLMLDSSPKLQVLKLMGVSKVLCPGQRKYAGEKWNQPKNVPECLLFYLETFMWTDYQGKREDEIEVAKYILSNSKHLKRATFSSKDISSKDRLVVVKDLNSVVRASNSCQLLIK